MNKDWSKKKKGGAVIYTHPSLTRAVVERKNSSCFSDSVTYDGVVFDSVEEAQQYALDALEAKKKRLNDVLETTLCLKNKDYNGCKEILINYDLIWKDGDVVCEKCGKYIRSFDAG